MHGAVINSKAMEMFGYSDGMPTPPAASSFGRGRRQPSRPGHGNRLPADVRQDAVPHARDGARRGQGRAADLRRRRRHHCQEAATHAPQVAQLQRIAKAGGFIIDVVTYPFMTDLEAVWKTTPPAEFGKYVNGLKLGGCKITADGSPQGRTAWFTTPYLTGGPAGEKDWKGEPGLPPEAMKATMKTCYDNNLQVLLHANGDAAIDFLLEAHKAAAGTDLAKDRRTVCIHCQFIRPDQLQQFAELKLIPSLFTDHTFFFGDTHVKNRGLQQASFISP